MAGCAGKRGRPGDNREVSDFDQPGDLADAACPRSAPAPGTRLRAAGQGDRLTISPAEGNAINAERTNQSAAARANHGTHSGTLREELGDVLLRVLLHARIAAEQPAGECGFTSPTWRTRSRPS
jgi:hypothetical protein